MIKTRINIEDWFVTLEKDVFPNGFDYVAKYKTIRDYMNSQIHSEIKAIVVKLIPETYLNDHGENHIKKVIEKASELLLRKQKILTPYETFFLLLAIQIHDAGHIINGRTEHAKHAQLIINKFGQESISSVEKKFIAQIAKAHSGKDDPIGLLNDEQVVSNQKVNLKLIASIVRLADELADDTTRASSFLLDNNLIEDKSKIFHSFSQCLDSCIVDSKQIKMNFYLTDKHLQSNFQLGDMNVFLLDEIYKRTIKTFEESVYCNRFLPEEIRIKSIDVQIIIDSEIDGIKPKEITYRLKEVGYPLSLYEDIFEICNLKSETGKHLTGDYYSNLFTK